MLKELAAALKLKHRIFNPSVLDISEEKQKIIIELCFNTISATSAISMLAIGSYLSQSR